MARISPSINSIFWLNPSKAPLATISSYSCTVSFKEVFMAYSLREPFAVHDRQEFRTSSRGRRAGNEGEVSDTSFRAALMDLAVVPAGPGGQTPASLQWQTEPGRH